MTKLEKILHTAKAHTTGGRETASRASSPAYRAYQILHVAFVIAPVLAGLDKFFLLPVNWDMYLAPPTANLSPIGGHRLMRVIGVVEIIAGILVAIKPIIGAYVVCAWLLGIAINLLIIPSFFDIALRDFGLALGALALGRLSQEFSSSAVRVEMKDRSRGRPHKRGSRC